MPNIEQQETSPGLTGEELLSASLALEAQFAQTDLYRALNQLDIPSDVVEVYKKLGTEIQPKKDEELPFMKRLGQGIKRELWDSRLGRTIAGTIVITTITDVVSGGDPITVSKVFVDFYNWLVGWAGKTIEEPEISPMIIAAGTAILWTLFSPKIYEVISARDTAKTIQAVTADAEAREKRAAEMRFLQEGTKDLRGMVGPNIQIDVGKSDPSALNLIKFFHEIGKNLNPKLEVVTYWDQRNIHFDQNPYWQKTYNDWTNRETLLRGNVEESLCSITLVSNGDDVFLSSRIQDPDREAQDMTDNEAIGSINARDAVRKNLNLPPTPHILVTNPQRIIDIGVAKRSAETFTPKTVSQVIKEKYPHVHIIDPDQLIIEELAQIASEDRKNKPNLPFELVTNSKKKEEYKTNLIKVMRDYNLKIDKDALKKKIRLASQKDGLETLSIVYGSNDDDTIMQIESYDTDFSKQGKLVAIINDPEKVTRLPEGTKYICVGNLVAKAIRNKFMELLIQGAIELPSPSQAKSDATA